MARDGGGVYSKPAGTTAVSGTTIASATFNTLIDDIVSDLNVDRPIVAGGTGASSAAAALVNLGLTATAAEINVLDGLAGINTTTTYRANTADYILTTDTVWDAMAEVSLSDGASISWDMDTGIDFTVTLGGNRALANATNVQVGKKGRLRVVQDGTGSRTLSFGTNYEFAGGTAPTLSTTAADEDILFYDCISATRIIITSLLDIS